MIKFLIWSIRISGEIFNKLKIQRVLASSLSMYDFSTLYATVPHKIKDKLTKLFEPT